MFAIEPRLFSIETIVVFTSIWPNQPIKLISSTSLNLDEQVYVVVEVVSILHVSSNIHVELVSVLLIKIVIPLDTFKQHLPKTFFQHEVG